MDTDTIGPKPNNKCEHKNAYYSDDHSHPSVSTWVCPDCTEVIIEPEDAGTGA